ncbi:MAG: phosphoribosylamine--glycine ligase [Terriglobales bacterium]|jgi:phosphoribosylamine--glycine ligase
MPKKVLVIGSGGREHALAWKIGQSPDTEVYCVPGNGGICNEARCVPGTADSIASLVQVVARIQPDLTVVGPEAPLALGIVDEFNRRGWRIFGPTQAAAQLESSKSFAKQFMQRHRIPTGRFATCTSPAELRDSLPLFSTPLVVKADGLAAGKGVVICSSKEEAESVASAMFSGKALGEAGKRVVLEEFLEGEELSFLVLSDGEHAAPLVGTQDHKRAGDNDTGPNTGGMGAYSTPEIVEPHMSEWLMTHIARPVIDGMKAEGTEYRGILYCGLIMTARGPFVLEFNCRFGDPETQPILMRMESDLVVAMDEAIDGRVSEGAFRWSGDASVCVVLASGGYPGAYEIGKRITGIQDAELIPGVKIFHAGTTRQDDEFYTAGGRVLGVTARGATLPVAIESAYAACAKIHFEGMHYRTDIGARPLKAR